MWGYIVTLSQNMKHTNTIQQSAKPRIQVLIIWWGSFSSGVLEVPLSGFGLQVFPW